MENTTQEISSIIDVEAVIAATELLLGLIVSLSVISFIWYIVSAIGYCKMFQKAGVGGWKAFIPFYNEYMRFKISWKGSYYFIYLIFSFIATTILTNNIAGVIISGIAYIAIIVLLLKMNIFMARSFGKGVGFGILLCIFPFITSLVLGFGKSQYIGNTTALGTPKNQ